MSADHTTTIRRFRTGSRGRVSRAECSCGYFGSNGTKREAEADERRHLRETDREQEERAAARAWWREAKKGDEPVSEQRRLVNEETDVSHGVSPDGFTTLCGIDTRGGDFDPGYGEWGDMSCGRCRRQLDTPRLARDLGLA